MKCANCGTESDGRFCPSCGASLAAGTCRECDATTVPGARFCTRCGTPVAPGSGRSRAAAGAGSTNTPWYIAGGVLLLLIAILVIPMLVQRGDAGTPAQFAPAGAGAPPPLSGTPRENADRLFDRIMRARARGDAAEALRFTPMAIQAYGLAAPLDNDGLYHLATVHLVAGDAASARSTAGDILAGNANHLLGLAIAGEAAEAAGDSAAARDYYARFLAAYETEVASGLQEYQDHAQVLPEYRATAQRIAGG